MAQGQRVYRWSNFFVLTVHAMGEMIFKLGGSSG